MSPNLIEKAPVVEGGRPIPWLMVGFVYRGLKESPGSGFHLKKNEFIDKIWNEPVVGFVSRQWANAQCHLLWHCDGGAW